MTDTIPIEELVPFLPYRLMWRGAPPVMISGRLFTDQEMMSLHRRSGDVWHISGTWQALYNTEAINQNEDWGIKPLVRPMHDLSKPLPNGEIPIMELLKLAQAFGKWGIIPGTSRAKGEHGSYFEYYVGRFYFHCIHEIDAVPDQRPLLQYLFRNHFDVYGWIEKGLALEKTEGVE